MKFVLGASSLKTAENKQFVSETKGLLSKSAKEVTVARTFAAILSYQAVDKYDALFIDWRILESNYEKFYNRLLKLNNHIPLIILADDKNISGELCLESDMLFAVIPRSQVIDSIPIIIKRLKKYQKLFSGFDQKAQIQLKPIGFGPFIGNADSSLDLYQQVAKISQTDFTALIFGKSGSGKELVASSIHNLSHRNQNSFVSLNCAAIPETLQESELFGYEKGAFTGADKAKAGKFELANNGTLFLDEVGDIPLDLQAKLLRVLELSTFTRLGAVKEQTVNVRYIAASNRRLSEEVRNNRFRSDLFYRLNVIPIELTPLSERDDDILLLCLRLIGKMIKKGSLNIKAISWDLIDKFKTLQLKGNIRELENILTRVVFYASGTILDEKVFASIDDSHHNLEDGELISENTEKKVRPLWELEKEAIGEAVKFYKGNLSRVASVLEISRSALYRKLKNYNLESE